LLYALRARQLLFPGSSAVEQPAVNRLVAGSNPARGAKLSQALNAETRTDKKPQKVPVATPMATTCTFRPRSK
jgi:hypothetical protein